jgi:hypothetical protein
LVTVWDFGNDFGFWQRFEILATILDFGNDLGFWQRFGILATIWDFGNGLGFGIWDFGKMLKLYFSICQIPNLFRHI